MTETRLMGLGLIQVIQDRFVQTSVAYSGRLGSGTRPAATDAASRWKKRQRKSRNIPALLQQLNVRKLLRDSADRSLKEP